MSGLASQADPQYVEIPEREKFFQQRLRLHSTFAVTEDGETPAIQTFTFQIKNVEYFSIIFLIGSNYHIMLTV